MVFFVFISRLLGFGWRWWRGRRSHIRPGFVGHGLNPGFDHCDFTLDLLEQQQGSTFAAYGQSFVKWRPAV